MHKHKVATVVAMTGLLLLPLFVLPAARADWDNHGRAGYWAGRDGDHRFIGYGGWRRGRWVHGWHEGTLGWWWLAGGLWYFYPRPVYPYPVYPAPNPPAQVVITPPAPAPQPQQYWYYCGAAKGYYPYVSSCPGGWSRVPAVPPQ
jgi:hypothetical protein